MPRWISLSVTLVAVIALVSSGGYVLARWYEVDSLVSLFATALKGSLTVVAACCAYACLVGLYHVILSVTGLDEEREEPTETRE